MQENVLYRCRGNESRRRGRHVRRARRGDLKPQAADDEEGFGRIGFQNREVEKKKRAGE